MRNSLARFNENIRSVREQSGLFDFLTRTVAGPFSFEDILRSQIVNAVSAFDKLIHDLIRVGMAEIYKGQRAPTPRYLAEAMTFQLHVALVSATLPPAEVLFDFEVVKKLRAFSFQDPDKISDGLSLIWPEKHKWQAISALMHTSPGVSKTTLKLIASRRNAIVHEADTDPISHLRTPISQAEASDVTDFLSNCGAAITQLVI